MEEEKLENKNIESNNNENIIIPKEEKIDAPVEEKTEVEPQLYVKIETPEGLMVKQADSLDKKHFSGLKTFSQDFADAIEKNQGVTIKDLIAEQEEKETEDKEFSPESKKNKTFILVGIILFLVAIGAVIFVVLKQSNFFAKDIQLNNTPIIFVENNEFLDISGLNQDQIKEKVFNFSKNASFKSGGILSFYLTQNSKVIGFKQLMQLINADYPANISNVISESFLIGLVDTRDTQIVSPVGGDMFMLLRTTSFVDVFELMRLWENKLFANLSSFWGFKLNADNVYLLTKDFEDGFANNKNARILTDKEGNIVFMYIFVDENNLIITNSLKSLNEVMNRLSAGRIGK